MHTMFFLFWDLNHPSWTVRLFGHYICLHSNYSIALQTWMSSVFSVLISSVTCFFKNKQPGNNFLGKAEALNAFSTYGSYFSLLLQKLFLYKPFLFLSCNSFDILTFLALSFSSFSCSFILLQPLFFRIFALIFLSFLHIRIVAVHNFFY